LIDHAVGDALQAAAFWAALHLLLMVGLAAGVIRLRRRLRVGVGDGGVPELTRAGRAFGNAAEYIPAALAGIVLVALIGAPGPLVHGLGAALLAGRVSHALGLSRSTGATTARLIGMMLTFGVYIVTAAALLFYAF
jgi:hypothetical protein